MTAAVDPGTELRALMAKLPQPDPTSLRPAAVDGFVQTPYAQVCYSAQNVAVRDGLIVEVGRITAQARERIRRGHGAMKQLRPEELRYFAQRHVPRHQHHAQAPAAKRHHGFTAPLRRKKFRLPRPRITHARQRSFAHRASHDAAKFTRRATIRRALHRRPRHERAISRRLARRRPKIFQAHGNLCRRRLERRQPTRWADHGDSCGFRRMRGEPRRHDLGADARGIAAREREVRRAHSVASSADARRARAKLRLPPLKNSRNFLASALG
jgi:hypothetical protein